MLLTTITPGANYELADWVEIGQRIEVQLSQMGGCFVMPTVRFVGRIYPLIAQVQITDLFPIDGVSQSLGLHMRFNLSMENNNVCSVACDINKWNSAEILIHVYMRSLDIARAFVDLASFSTGIGLTILFDTLVDPDGNETRLLLQHPELGALATSVKNIQKPEKAEDNNYDRVARLVTTNYPVSRALHDLIDAIRETHVSPLVCGRAIEGIRHAMSPRLDRKKGWAQVRMSLRVDRSYLDLILDTSTGPRHADPEPIPGDVCIEISKRSWIIMNRFFEYLKRGSQPLPESEFPLLESHS